MSQIPHSDPLEEARLLLPWYITGKLSAEEKQLVETMLAQSPELQEDYQQERKLCDAVKNNAGVLQLTAMDTTQHRLDKLLRRIEKESAVADSAAVASVSKPHIQTISVKAKESVWQRLKKLLPDGDWLVPANAVFASLVAIQVGVVSVYLYDKNQPDTVLASATQEASGVYQTATATTAGEGVNQRAAVNGMVLLVDFNSEANIRQVVGFLNQWNARVLDGPDANNLFKIELRNVKKDNEHSMLILQKIQQDEHVVAFAGREF